MPMYYVYILKSEKTGTYYIGCTSNLERRLGQHNKGTSQYTMNKGPWVLKYNEDFLNLSGARQREKQIKSWKKRIAIEKLINGAIV